MGSYRGRTLGSRTERARSVAGVRTLTAGCRSGGSGGTPRRPLLREVRFGVALEARLSTR